MNNPLAYSYTWNFKSKPLNVNWYVYDASLVKLKIFYNKMRLEVGTRSKVSTFRDVYGGEGGGGEWVNKILHPLSGYFCFELLMNETETTNTTICAPPDPKIFIRHPR